MSCVSAIKERPRPGFAGGEHCSSSIRAQLGMERVAEPSGHDVDGGQHDTGLVKAKGFPSLALEYLHTLPVQ